MDDVGAPLLTRTQAARLASVTRGAIRKWEESGRLKAIVVDGIHHFTRDSVLAAVRVRETSSSACAFKLFDEGKTAIEVVRELNEDPEYIGRLFDGYQQLKGNIVVRGPKSMRQWSAVYGLQFSQLTPTVLLKCIEIVCSNPKLRAQLELPAPSA